MALAYLLSYLKQCAAEKKDDWMYTEGANQECGIKCVHRTSEIDWITCDVPCISDEVRQGHFKGTNDTKHGFLLIAAMTRNCNGMH